MEFSCCANCNEDCPIDETTSCLLTIDPTRNDELTIFKVMAQLYGISDELQRLMDTCSEEDQVPRLCQQCLRILNRCFELWKRFLHLCHPGSSLISIFGNRRNSFEKAQSVLIHSGRELKTADNENLDSTSVIDPLSFCPTVKSEPQDIDETFNDQCCDDFQDEMDNSDFIDEGTFALKVETDSNNDDPQSIDELDDDCLDIVVKQEADVVCDTNGDSCTISNTEDPPELKSVNSGLSTTEMKKIKRANHTEAEQKLRESDSDPLSVKINSDNDDRGHNKSRLRVRLKCSRCSKVFPLESKRAKHEKTHDEETGFDYESQSVDSPESAYEEQAHRGDDSDCQPRSSSDDDNDETDPGPRAKRRTNNYFESRELFASPEAKRRNNFGSREKLLTSKPRWAKIIPPGPLFSCSDSDCQGKFYFQAELMCHIQLKHLQQFNCTLCDFGRTEIKTKDQLWCHFFSHTQEKVFRCLVPHCEFKSVRRGTIVRHSERPHTHGKRSLRSQVRMLQDVKFKDKKCRKSEDEPVKSVKCSQCSATFMHPILLNAHYRRVHEEQTSQISQ